MYDVIIVGARVAGASTAMLLARRGVKVLVVDRATFPSDTLSTHQVQLPGVARLARWGVLDPVLAAGTPVTRGVRFDQGDTVITGQYPAYQGVEVMCSPRRTLLDRVLADAARAAGAEVRENFAVEEILGDGEVTGVRGREKGAPAVTEQARLVIGADGKHSLVAKAVNARAYRAGPPRSIAFYTYWADVPARDGSPPGTGEIYGRPGCAVGAWPTNDGLLMTYLAWPAARFDEFRLDVEGNFLRTLDAVGLGERIRAGRRAERFRGTPDLPSYLRQPYGPGWALVGDAGLLLDPITGQGISHAFRDAELLADAVADGLGGIRPLAEALARYHRARDRAARPMYDFTARLAGVNPPGPAEMALFRALARRQEDSDMFLGVLAGSIPLRQFMSPRTMVRLVGASGFARLMLGQARPHRADAATGPQPAEGTSARSTEDAVAP
jgi:2-polyprenyl-6-methoxyphenol hydroxylase-like FAD-dependent oxidoreductase